MKLFLDVQDAGQPGAFQLRVTRDISVGASDSRFLFGGVGLASAIMAMERACGQTLIWATAQYLIFARPPQIISLEVEKLAASRYTTQATAVGRADGETLFRAFGALGARPGEVSRQWPMMPAVPPPESCPVGHHWRGDTQGLHGRLDVRVARGRYGRDRVGHPEPDGRLIIWVRPTERVEIDAAMLAVIADLLPNAVGNALGMNAGGSSLDNTLRVMRTRPWSWVLAEISVHGIESGFAHGDVRMFADDGALLATASQSLVMRIRSNE
jgi:acyl-CoA thioesterase